MNPVAFILVYTRWHYGTALFDILRVWGNFLWLSLHFFSTKTLVSTLFSPFMRMQEEYPEKGHFDPEYFAGTILVNTIMRFVGFLVRLVFILLSLIAFSLVFVLGSMFLVLWIFAPIFLTSFISVGLDLIV